MFADIVLLVVSLGVILTGAGIFTNAVEWLGKKLLLSEGAVGSVLAAVGTALPETMVPIVALIGGKAGAEDVGIGAILGAPFMLGTIAFFVIGASSLFFRQRRQRSDLKIDCSVINRDLNFFLMAYVVAISAAFLPWRGTRIAIVVFLLFAYFYYLINTFKNCGSTGDHDLSPLFFARRTGDPSMFLIVMQIITALAAITLGAHFFVDSLSEISIRIGIPALLLSLVITPIATELPEKFNSIIWVRDGKDTLAMGNVTGAMVFQSSIIPVIGIAFTKWEISSLAVGSAVLALLSAILVKITIWRYGKVRVRVMLTGGVLYLIFLGFIVWAWVSGHSALLS